MSVSKSMNTSLTFYQCLIYLQFFIFFVAGTQISQNPKSVKRWVDIWYVLALINSVYSICQYYGFDFTDRIHRYQAVGTFGNKNYLAGFLAPILMIPFSYIKNSKSKRNISVHLIAFFIMSTSLLMTNSRGGWLTGLFVISTWIIFQFKYNKNEIII